ncbi:TetR/AcrR family transcriptional regulator [Cedecea sp. MMO-103]|uniref:TetR/AcrR family transcriptional regulator n=1 Tax=Cedecea sp. MMO-103 TaxID=3081238 RepID=UPI003016C6F7
MSTRIQPCDNGMRKLPKQKRSQATVSAIVEAATQVLGEKGWRYFTTNEVAEFAGVSIGSLYQYFPNKLVLVEAIRKKHFSDVINVLQAASENTEDVNQSFNLLIEGMLSVHGAHPALHRALVEEAPRSDEAISAHAEFEKKYNEYYLALVSRYGARRNAQDIQTAAWTLSAAIEGVVHQAALRGLTGSPALKRELVQLLFGYLRGQTA